MVFSVSKSYGSNKLKRVLCCLLVLTTTSLHASKKNAQDDTLAKYLAKIQMGQPVPPALSVGSLWVDNGRMASLSADYKATSVGDLIEIVVVQGVTATNANAVTTARKFSVNSGITALPGPKPSRVSSVREPGLSRMRRGYGWSNCGASRGFESWIH